MIYVMQPSVAFPTSQANIKAPLYSTKRKSPKDDFYNVKLTNDLSKESKTFRPQVIQNTKRFSNILFNMVNDISLENLGGGQVFFEPTGSYTYIVSAESDGFIHARGKLIMRAHGVFTTATKFGNEVEYEEHTNPTTNNIYLQA